MPQFCDVALPVPLDMVFVYHAAATLPVVGGRVLVPFRNERLAGVVTALHDHPPEMQTKSVLDVLDSQPLLDATLMQLGQWISQYYLAPIGEVFRTMLPLGAEIKKAKIYRITDVGHEVLHASATGGSSRRSRQEIDAQMMEYAVLDYLSTSDDVLEGTIRSATGANRRMLDNLVRKKWIAREDASAARDARRMIQIAVLKDVSGKLNENQQKIVAALQEAGSRLAVDQIRNLPVPRTTLHTLVKRGIVERVEEAAEFRVSGLKKQGPSHLDFIFNAQQKAALDAIQQALRADRAARELRAKAAELRGRYASLTPREREIMQMVIAGRLKLQARRADRSSHPTS
jgi:primosomal protein N' (replication factor Y)